MHEVNLECLAVEKFSHLHLIRRGEGEVILYEGGCVFTEGTSSFGFPYDDICKTIKVPSTLWTELIKEVMEIGEISEGDQWESYCLSEETESVERRILKNERTIALLAQSKGVDLKDYFKSYEGKEIYW